MFLLYSANRLRLQPISVEHFKSDEFLFSDELTNEGRVYFYQSDCSTRPAQPMRMSHWWRHILLVKGEWWAPLFLCPSLFSNFEQYFAFLSSISNVYREYECLVHRFQPFISQIFPELSKFSCLKLIQFFVLSGGHLGRPPARSIQPLLASYYIEGWKVGGVKVSIFDKRSFLKTGPFWSDAARIFRGVIASLIIKAGPLFAEIISRAWFVSENVSNCFNCCRLSAPTPRRPNLNHGSYKADRS